MRLGFPADLLCLFCTMHASSRAIATAGCYSSLIECLGRSILMGCTSSTRLARASLHSVLAEVHAEAEGGGCEVSTAAHVDDVTQLLTSDSSQALFEAAVAAGPAFAEKNDC